jgi:hypothetical protein
MISLLVHVMMIPGLCSNFCSSIEDCLTVMIAETECPEDDDSEKFIEKRIRDLPRLNRKSIHEGGFHASSQQFNAFLGPLERKPTARPRTQLAGKGESIA